VNFKNAGRCPVCKQVWQAKPSQWAGGRAPRCPDCGGRLTRAALAKEDRAEAIADHLQRGRRRAAD